MTALVAAATPLLLALAHALKLNAVPLKEMLAARGSRFKDEAEHQRQIANVLTNILDAQIDMRDRTERSEKKLDQIWSRVFGKDEAK